jgi:SAM-dependent methyltransferase
MTPSGTDNIDAFTAFEHEGWQNVGKPYADYFGGLTTQSIEPLLDAVEVSPGTRVLDVASGPGYVAAAAARRQASVVGLDFSSAMVAQASQRYPGIEFRVGSALDLPFPEASFDATVIGFGMLHFAQPDQALAEACRVLRRGGRVGFTVWAKPDRALAFGILTKAVQAHGDMNVPLPQGPPFFRFSEPQECIDTLGRLGFAQTRTVEVAQVWKLASPATLFDAFWQSTVRFGALLRAQAPDALVRIRTAVESAAKEYQHPSGEIELPMPAMLTCGVKA